MATRKKVSDSNLAAANKDGTGGLAIDKGTVLGLLIALGGIVGGLLLERGSLADIAQGTAALIVLGGTVGAVLVGTPFADVIAAIRELKYVFFDPGVSSQAMLEQLIGFATKARRNGIVSLEEEADRIEDPFLRKAINLAIDVAELTELKHAMQLDQEMEERRLLSRAKVFESAGGYSPTIGIIGAVLGLIQVMKNLANIEEVGRGIAVAFVATIYGVGAANLLFLPVANKIRGRAKRRIELTELMLEGVAGIV
ncbi:MAG: flagellar motor protein, partial [Bryobacteraceae bacterium]